MSHFDTLPVTEDNYAQIMTQTVEPYLASLREDRYFNSFDGNRIHYEQYLKPDAEGSVVIIHGFTESARKFREMSYYFLLMGFSVFAIDNRGHGLSYRRERADNQVVSVGHFDDYIRDLDVFFNTVISQYRNGKPVYIYSHSMGGGITVRFLQDHPGYVDKAILSAPMIRAKAPLPLGVARAVTGLFVLFGQGDKRVFMHSPYNPDYAFDTSHDTSKARFDYYKEIRNSEPLLQTSSGSYRWVREAMTVPLKTLNKKLNQKIDIPVLLFQPEEDSSVESDKEDEFISMIPHGRLVKLKHCKHEIYCSIDETMLEYLRTIESFLNE